MTSYLDLAEQALHGSEQKKWNAALISAYCVGSYENGWAQSLADRMGYNDVSMVYNLADAGKARKALRMKARDVYRYRISVFTYCQKVISAGHSPEAVRHVLQDMLHEWQRPKMKDVTDALAGMFEMPTKEPTAQGMIKLLDKLVSWGASKVDHAHRKEWDEHTSGLRRILKVSN